MGYRRDASQSDISNPIERMTNRRVVESYVKPQRARMSSHHLSASATRMICIAEMQCASALANEGMIGLGMWHLWT